MITVLSTKTIIGTRTCLYSERDETYRFLTSLLFIDAFSTISIITNPHNNM